jgi:hypothetical protein
MSKYITSILLLLLTSQVWAQQDSSGVKTGSSTDTVRRNKGKRFSSASDTVFRDTADVSIADILNTDTTVAVADTPALSDSTRTGMLKHRDSLHQLRIGFDISKPLLKLLVEDSLSFRESFEFEIDHYFKKELYFVLEGGWGSGRVDYPDLKYSTKNTFFKAGINKSLLVRQGVHDWDQAFIGARYAMAFINRSDAYYQTDSTLFWGNTSGTIPADKMIGHWFEVTAGTRLEVWRGIFIGWNVRGKFRLNKKPFEELPPYFIAGYGKGDKKSIFDFNFYLSYAIRWQ